MVIELPLNAITDIITGDHHSKPTIQVLEMKLISLRNECQRYSVATELALVSIAFHERMKTYGIKEGSVVKLLTYAYVPATADSKIIVVVNMDPVIIDCEIIGNSKSVNKDDYEVTPECEIIRNPKQSMESNNLQPQEEIPTRCDNGHQPLAPIMGQSNRQFAIPPIMHDVPPTTQ